MAEHNYDLVVIGSGPGGYVGAIRASQLGLKTAIVERDKPGGVCLNIGCIPSKALIHQAEVYGHGAELEKLGVKLDYNGFDYRKVQKKSRNAADKLSKGVQFLLKKNDIEYIRGTGRVTGKNEVSVDGKKKLSCKNIMIATGSQPRGLPGFEFDEDRVLSSTGVLMMTELPRRLVILGAGAIGMEFAHVMSAFGVEVTVVEMLERILPLEDAEAVEVIAKAFKGRGITMLTAAKATGLERGRDALRLTVEQGGETRTLECDKLLVAVGRAPNSADLGLEELGVKIEKGFIETENYYRTAVAGIYAVGDVIATPLLAHWAMKEAEIAAEHMAGHAVEPRLPDELGPSAVYTVPEIGSFGPTEEQARERGLEFEKAVFPYRGAGKSVAAEQSEGLVKVLYDRETREILAGHVVGANATELIHELLLAKKGELLPADIATMVHAHPTLSEAVMEAARTAEGWAVHA